MKKFSIAQGIHAQLWGVGLMSLLVQRAFILNCGWLLYLEDDPGWEKLLHHWDRVAERLKKSDLYRDSAQIVYLTKLFFAFASLIFCVQVWFFAKIILSVLLMQQQFKVFKKCSNNLCHGYSTLSSNILVSFLLHLFDVHLAYKKVRKDANITCLWGILPWSQDQIKSVWIHT